MLIDRCRPIARSLVVACCVRRVCGPAANCHLIHAAIRPQQCAPPTCIPPSSRRRLAVDRRGTSGQCEGVGRSLGLTELDTYPNLAPDGTDEEASIAGRNRRGWAISLVGPWMRLGGQPEGRGCLGKCSPPQCSCRLSVVVQGTLTDARRCGRVSTAERTPELMSLALPSCFGHKLVSSDTVFSGPKHQLSQTNTIYTVRRMAWQARHPTPASPITCPAPIGLQRASLAPL